MKNVKLNQYIVNAFTDVVFKRNPAAVCILNSWLEDEILLKITQENNLSEISGKAVLFSKGEIYL